MKLILNKIKFNPNAKEFVPKKKSNERIWTNPKTGQTVIILCTTKTVPSEYK